MEDLDHGSPDPGELVYVRFRAWNSDADARNSIGETLECVVIGEQDDVVWCSTSQCKGIQHRPTPGQEVEITIPSSHVAKTCLTRIARVKLTRRGLAFAFTSPKAWEIKMFRPSVRVPISFDAGFLRKEDVARAGARPLPTVVTNISMTGARIRSRVLLKQGDVILLTFPIGDPPEQVSVLGRVARTVSTTTMINKGYEVGLRFIKVGSQSRRILQMVIQDVAAEVQEARRREADDRARELSTDMSGLRPTRTAEDVDKLALEYVDDEIMTAFLESA